MTDRRKAAFVCAALLASSLSGCATAPRYEQPARVRWADDAGSVTVAPISVTRWEDVAASLQPRFKMDSEIALAAAIPTTQTLDERFSDILAASLQASLPAATSTRTVTTSTDPETGETTTSIDGAETRSSGDLTSLPGAAALPPSTIAALAALAGDKPARDPMLRYLAATALLQEVTLLNRYVTDKIQETGDQAFLVRLQLAVMPNRRGMPYDVLTDITLHAADEQQWAQLAADSGSDLQCAEGSYDSLNIVPMVVTDNLEGLQASRSSDVARQIGLSLLGTVQGVGAGGSFARTTDLLRATQGNEANSLLTVAKLADNTVRVRLGAVQSPTYQYTTLPRTHNISLLVVYKPCKQTIDGELNTESPRTITAVTRTTFRDAISGSALPYEDATGRLYRQMGQLRSKYPGNFTYLEFVRLFQWAQKQDRKSFFEYMDRKALRSRSCGEGLFARIAGARFYPDADDPYGKNLLEHDTLTDLMDTPQSRALEETVLDNNRRPLLSDECRQLSIARYRIVGAGLWTDLIGIRPAGEFAFTRIPLALRSIDRRLPPAQVALVSFSRAESTVTLTQGQDLVGLQKLRAVLVDAKSDQRISATETAISADGMSVSAKFPPLERFGKPEDANYGLELSVESFDPDDSPCYTVQAIASPAETCVERYKVVLFNSNAPAATSAYSIGATASGIVADSNGRGRLNVSIRQRPGQAFSSKLFLKIEGAEIGRIETLRGAAVEVKPEGWRVTSPGELTVWLENLIPNQVVKVALEDDGKAVPGIVEKTVIATQPVAIR